MMKRSIYKDLLIWKESTERKPLLLQGARQVGKTYLMREFGKNEYANAVYINFEEKKTVSSFFDDDIDPAHIIKSLEAHYYTSINPSDTLIIFDEIQESSRALNSLKYFNENAPQYHIIAAGSFLGVAMHGSFPVGKVDRITLYPLSFFEFLEGTGNEQYLEYLKKKNFDLIRIMAKDYEKLLKTYFIVGGMPKAVSVYAERKDILEVRAIQKTILEDYKDDFSKHITAVNTPKVKIIWDSVPFHLSKEKKKFVYKDIKTGARAYAYEDAMNWLFNTRLVYKVSRVTDNKLPLSIHADDRQAFKLYMLDVGLFAAKAEVDLTAIFEGSSAIFANFNGALTEQFVLQELITAGFTPYYWGREKGAAEVDFIIQWKNEVVPVEVKTSIRKKSKSLNVYRDLYQPAHIVRTTLNNYGKYEELLSLPLYMIGCIGELLAASAQ